MKKIKSYHVFREELGDSRGSKGFTDGIAYS